MGKLERISLLILGALMPLAASAQTPAEARQSLEAALKGKQLPIRGFPGAPVIHYTWKNDHMERDPEKVYSVGVFEADSVKVRDTHGQMSGITIKGSRKIVLQGDSGGFVLSRLKRPVVLEIDARGITNAELAKLPTQLFFADIPEAMEALPAELAAAVPATETPQRYSGPKQGTWIEQDGAWRQLDVEDKPTMPKVVYSPEPEFPEEARKVKVSGNVTVTILVTPEGHVGEVWLDRPLGSGCDEMAIKAASKYRFEPATYHGQPVGIVMNIEINFQIF